MDSLSATVGPPPVPGAADLDLHKGPETLQHAERCDTVEAHMWSHGGVIVFEVPIPRPERQRIALALRRWPVP